MTMQNHPVKAGQQQGMSKMTNYLIAYVIAAVAFNWGALLAWTAHTGSLGWPPVLLYLAGMMWFGVKPGLESGNWTVALLNGALLGALCYATFDLTSQAVFKVWATKISIMDICWGAFATGTTSAITTWATLKITS